MTFLILHKHANTFWLVLAALCLGLLLVFPDWLSRERLSGFLNGLGAAALLAYVALSLSRALLLLPCTPFVLAGGVAFPQWPWLVLLISFAGIAAGAFVVYSFPSVGNYREFLERNFPKPVSSMKRRLHGPWAPWIVMGWSFTPFVPTDMICYAAGVARMPFKRLVTALLIGEAPLVTVYVLVGAEVGFWLRG